MYIYVAGARCGQQFRPPHSFLPPPPLVLSFAIGTPHQQSHVAMSSGIIYSLIARDDIVLCEGQPRAPGGTGNFPVVTRDLLSKAVLPDSGRSSYSYDECVCAFLDKYVCEGDPSLGAG